MYRGQRAQALTRYNRALRIDPDLALAADRYVFVSMQEHTASALGSSIAVADAFLRRQPNNADVLADRGMCYVLEHRYAKALSDFEAAARLSAHTAQYSMAAAVLRRRVGVK